MKLRSSLMLVGLFTFGCANAPNEFRIAKFYPLLPGCDSSAREDSIAGNGFLDVAAGNPALVVGVEITGAENVAQRPVQVGQVLLESTNRNRPLVTQQVVNYRLSKRVGGTPKPYITNISLPFSDDGLIFGAIQVLSPELGQALVDGLTPSSGVAPSNAIEDFVDINIDVEFNGEYSATRHPFSTGVLSFPVRAYRSNPGTCANGYVKYALDPSTNQADACSYVGMTFTQLVQPGLPTCCSAVGPAGGPGC